MLWIALIAPASPVALICQGPLGSVLLFNIIPAPRQIILQRMANLLSIHWKIRLRKFRPDSPRRAPPIATWAVIVELAAEYWDDGKFNYLSFFRLWENKKQFPTFSSLGRNSRVTMNYKSQCPSHLVVENSLLILSKLVGRKRAQRATSSHVVTMTCNLWFTNPRVLVRVRLLFFE